MKLTLDIPDAIASHFNSVMVPIMSGLNQELDEFGKIYRKAYLEAAEREGHNDPRPVYQPLKKEY